MKTNVIAFDAEARVAPRLQVTQHAFKRARERLHWRTCTLLRMAERALLAGFAPEDSVGPLKYYLESKASAELASCPFLYGENVYVFGRYGNDHAVTLLTVYRAPQALLRALKPKRRRAVANAIQGEN